MSLFLVAAMIVSAVPALTVSAQNEAVVAAQVRGELNERFAKHYLELQVTDPTQSVRIVMDYNPKDRQELDQGAGFYVFDEAGFRSLVNGANPATTNLAVGALETATGVKQKVAIIADPVGSFTVVPYNDSIVPMDYTLTVENAVLRDASGDQVTDPLAPAVDSADDAATTDETTTDEATAVATVEAAATVTTTTATTGTTTVVTATATPEAATAVSATPLIIRVSQLEGELNERFATHYYELRTQDIGREVTIEMTYNPQDQQALDNGLNFYAFTVDQFRSLRGAPSSAINTAAGELITDSSPKTKRAVINEPFSTYTVIVENNSDIPTDYQLTVDNAVLIDESGQSITAQELGAGTVTATGEITGTTTTTTTTTTATGTSTTTTTATTGAAAITPPTTYTVVAGDTLGTIANRAYGSVQLYNGLCAYNNIADCNRIEVGDQIEIPAQADLPSAATTTQATATPAAAATPTSVATPAVGASTTVTDTTPAETDTETDTEAEAETPATTVNTTATGDLVATASSFSVLDTLGLLLDLLELEQDPSNNIKAVLQGGNYTFFAPTDTAFTSLDEATLETLIANPSQLATVLRGHIVPGQVVAADLSDGMMIETLAGTMLPVTVNGSTVTVGGATVAQSDVLATNGVIHVIDTVLTGAE